MQGQVNKLHVKNAQKSTFFRKEFGYMKKMYYLCRKFQAKETDMAGIIKLNSIARQYSGGLDETYYVRRPVGHPAGVAVLCKKPRYSKKQRKAMAERSQVKRFVEVNREAQAIYHDPVLRAEWEARHKAAQREASRHGHSIYPRLWDYIRHELSESKKRQ